MWSPLVWRIPFHHLLSSVFQSSLYKLISHYMKDLLCAPKLRDSKKLNEKKQPKLKEDIFVFGNDSTRND